MFKAGDRVVCVDVSRQRLLAQEGLVNGSIYTVRSVRDGCRCCPQYVNVGLPPLGAVSECPKCGKCVPGSWAYAHRFRKVQDQSITSKLVEQFNESHVEECPEYVPQTQEA